MGIFKFALDCLFWTFVFYVLIFVCDGTGLLQIPGIVYSMGGVLATVGAITVFCGQFRV